VFKVLIVDDEERIRNGLTTIIDWEAHGFTVCGSAGNGREGIERAKEEKPDLMLVDIRMPGIDGIQMIERLQEEGIFCRYLILSGAKDFEYAQRAIDLRVAAYLLKPVSRDELSERVRALFSDAGKTAADERAADAAEVVKRVKEYMSKHFDKPLLLNVIADEMHYSAPYLGRIFKKITGGSFHGFLEELRMEKAKEFLRDGHKVYVVSQMSGYGDVDYFADKFKAYTGMTPSAYRDENRV